MAISASDELDLKRTTFALSPEERALGPSLKNDLHPLHRRFNFRASALTYDTTGEDDNEPFHEARVHDRMVPAFRLASRLLEFSLPFFAKVFRSDLVFVGEQYAFEPMYRCTDTNIQRVRDLLMEWSERICFYCRTPPHPSMPDEYVPEATSEARTGGRPLPTPARSLISISMKSIDFFTQENYDEIDVETKTSRLVQTDLVLIHEQVHVIFCHRWAEDPELSENQRAFIPYVSPREPMYHVHITLSAMNLDSLCRPGYTAAVFSAAGPHICRIPWRCVGREHECAEIYLPRHVIELRVLASCVRLPKAIHLLEQSFCPSGLARTSHGRA